MNTLTHFFTNYNTIKALHIIFMVTWFAGLFYLPRIFVYHAMNNKPDVNSIFKVMERKLMIMTHIGATLTLVFGVILIIMNMGLFKSPWFHAKLTIVFLLFIYHFCCYRLMLGFRHDRNKHSHKYYRYFNEAPSFILIIVVILAVTKPVFGN